VVRIPSSQHELWELLVPRQEEQWFLVVPAAEEQWFLVPGLYCDDG
jgi:hypothetical protein